MRVLGVDVEALLGKAIDDPLVCELGLNCSMVEREDVTCFTMRHLGIVLVFDEHRVLHSIQLYGPGRDPDFAGFGDPLPRGLDFSDSCAEVIAKLGEPQERGAGDAARMLGKRPPWTRHTCDRHDLLVQFKHDESAIDLVEITRRS